MPRLRAAHRLPVRQNAIGFAPVDGRLDDLPGDDLALLLEVVVPAAELLQGPVVEGLLVVRYELLPIRRGQGGKGDFGHGDTSVSQNILLPFLL